MTIYLLIKWLHVMSSTVLFGTGLGSAFYMFMANRRRDIAAIYFAVRHVVIADWLFIAPAVMIQPVTGFWLAESIGVGHTTPWLQWALALYVFTGACWLPVVWIQIKMRDMAKQALAYGGDLPALYWKMHRIWVALGCLAFTAVVAIFYLMVAKPV